MNKQQLEEIRKSDEWVKIRYFTRYSSGTLIIKYKLYSDIRNKPSFKRKFKDCIFMYIDFKYHVTMTDIVRSALEKYKRRYDLETYKIHQELKRMNYDPWNIKVYTERRNTYANIIKRLERKLT